MRVKLLGVKCAFGYSIYFCAGLLTLRLFVKITGRARSGHGAPKYVD
jgi:lipopolysaccharide transport system permease protein